MTHSVLTEHKPNSVINIWWSHEDNPIDPSSSSPQWLCGGMLAMDGQWQSSCIVSVRTNRVLNKHIIFLYLPSEVFLQLKISEKILTKNKFHQSEIDTNFQKRMLVYFDYFNTLQIVHVWCLFRKNISNTGVSIYNSLITISSFATFIK